MLPLIQLLLAAFAIYSALEFKEALRLLVPLGCLFLMLFVSRLDRSKSEKEKERKSYLRSEIDKVSKQGSTTIKDQDFFTIESLLWPKSELLLIDAVHFVFKDLEFKISAGGNSSLVDRIVKIPETQKAFGVEILMSEREVEPNHPKLSRALQFEKEKMGNEKILIIASTHTCIPLSERGQVNDLSKEIVDFLIRHHISLITAHQLYTLWQKSKGGEIDIFGCFQQIYSHQGGIFALKGNGNSHSLSFNPLTPESLSL